MALPELIEIVPLSAPVRAEITVPGSKSITNRALILAALADGEVTLTGALWSEDTQIMVECLQKLGFEIRVENDPAEFCNRTIIVKGLGGKFPDRRTGVAPVSSISSISNGGRLEACPTELFVGNAGTAARFLSAFVCLGEGVCRLSGVARMHERPQAALFKALRELGYRVESENGNDKLPVKIWGKAESGKRKAETSCKVSIEESSQFASALLLCAKIGNWEVEVVGENAEESPYVAMTLKLMKAFPKNGGTFQIELDASSGSYFLGVGWLIYKELSLDALSNVFENPKLELQQKHKELLKLRSQQNQILVKEWPDSDLQIDSDFAIFVRAKNGGISIEISRSKDLGDSIMTAITLAPFNTQPVKFTSLGRLRVQETERVVALRTELTKCGAKVVEEGDTLTVWPSPLHGAEIETYNDHRMAMCFAVLGLKVPGIKIKNPACVKKTFPNFFQKLAAPPPHGLGAEIWEIKNGQRTRKLSGEDLFAD
jgi:3-phosphoshikimate 1-carboxyvinyltransferase